MPGMSYEDIRDFRRDLANTVITQQNMMLRTHDKATVISNMIAGLLSLAAYLARKNAHMSRSNLERVCEAAIDEQYQRDELLRWTS